MTSLIEAGTRIENDIAVIVMKGTGRASDLIGTATDLLKEGKYGDLDSQRLVLHNFNNNFHELKMRIIIVGPVTQLQVLLSN